MSDRELLELAAKAAGIEIYFDDDGDCYRVFASGNHHWNPLHFDGDALRLAVRLQLQLGYAGGNQYYAGPSTTDKGIYRESGECNGIQDPYAATRRAIVRAAAEIGRQP